MWRFKLSFQAKFLPWLLCSAKCLRHRTPDVAGPPSELSSLHRWKQVHAEHLWQTWKSLEKPWRLLSRLQHHPAWRVWQWVSDGVGRHVLLCVGECHTVLGMWAEVPLMDVRTAWSLCPTSNPLVLVLHVSRGAPPIPPHTQQQILSLRMVSPPHSWHRMLLCNLNMPQVIFPKRADWHLRSLTDFVF